MGGRLGGPSFGVLTGTLGVGIHTETTDERMGRKTPVSRPWTIMTMQNTIVVKVNNTWAVKKAHAAL